MPIVYRCHFLICGIIISQCTKSNPVEIEDRKCVNFFTLLSNSPQLVSFQSKRLFISPPFLVRSSFRQFNGRFLFYLIYFCRPQLCEYFSCQQLCRVVVVAAFCCCCCCFHSAPVWSDWVIYWNLGNFLKPLATINLPKSPTILGNFFSEIIFGQLL